MNFRMPWVAKKLFLELFIVFSEGSKKKLIPQKILAQVKAKKTSFFQEFSDIFAHVL